MQADGSVLQNRYRILRTLSDKGGMGVVYQAEDQRLGSTVVVKETRYLQMKPEVRDLMLKAFFREARLLANLQHPALPRVTDYFVEGDGHFLVMEFIRGKDLEELLAERGTAFPVDDVLRWADRLLEALEYLHGHDEPIIHRDIKPANLTLTPRGDIMLLDFGLAKGAAGGLQAASSVFGYTKQYASWEQIKGKGTDARSDLFSLGATLYHLLTGKRPPDAAERVSEVAIGSSDPLKTAADLNRSVPADVSTAIFCAMALKPDERPASAVLMRQALRMRSISVAPTVPDELALSARPKTIESFTDELDGIKLEMIYIPSGKFTMGSKMKESEKPPHGVVVPAFYIGKFQITQAQWKAVMGSNPSHFKGDDNLPVENVSWNNAKEFCQKLGQLTGNAYRLPSEAEWEYACRAGTIGDYAGNLEEMAWYSKNSGSKPHAVGRKEPNAFGLHDMHGNVWEWCEDVWHVNYQGAPTDGSAWIESGNQGLRIVRGGSWYYDAGRCRSGFRQHHLPGSRHYSFGFRVVMSTSTQ